MGGRRSSLNFSMPGTYPANALTIKNNVTTQGRIAYLYSPPLACNGRTYYADQDSEANAPSFSKGFLSGV